MLPRQEALSPITFIAERTLTNLAESQKSSPEPLSALSPQRPAFADRLKKSQSRKPKTSLESTAISRPEPERAKKTSDSNQSRDVQARRSEESSKSRSKTRTDSSEQNEITEENVVIPFSPVNRNLQTDAEKEIVDAESVSVENVSAVAENANRVEATIPFSLLSATTRRQQAETSDEESLSELDSADTAFKSIAPLTLFKALDQRKTTAENPLEGEPILSVEDIKAAVKIATSQDNAPVKMEVLNQSNTQNQSTENEGVAESVPVVSLDSQELSGQQSQGAVTEELANLLKSETQPESEQSVQTQPEALNSLSAASQQTTGPQEDNSEREPTDTNAENQLSQTVKLVQDVQVAPKSEIPIKVHQKEQPTEVDSEESDSSGDSNPQQTSQYANGVNATRDFAAKSQVKPPAAGTIAQAVSNPIAAAQSVTLETTKPQLSTSDQQSSLVRSSELNAISTENRTALTDVKTEVVRPVLDTSKNDVPQRLTSFIQQAAEQGKALKIRLHPPELGTLQIEVNRLNGQVNARIEVESASARSVIFEQLGLLKESLTQQGIKVDQLQVEINEQLANDSGNSFSGETGSREAGQDQERQQEQRRSTGVEGNRDVKTDENPNTHASKIGVSEIDVQV